MSTISTRHLLETGNMNVRKRLAFRSCHLRLRAVQHLLEFCNTRSHPRVHVCLRTLDMIVKVISEELNMRDGGLSNVRFCEMPRE